MEKSSKTPNIYAIDRLLEHLSGNVARFRTAKGYTLEKLSKESGVAISRISEIESRDAEDIQLSTITKLAHALGCKPFELMGASELDFNSSDYARLEQALELLLTLRHRKR
jgi:transcriptional regulator with XRE-family HTH domain